VTATDVRMVKAAVARQDTGTSISGSARDAFRTAAATGQAELPDPLTGEQLAQMMDRRKCHRVYDPNNPKKPGNSNKVDDEANAIVKSLLIDEWKKNAAACKRQWGYSHEGEDADAALGDPEAP